MGYTKAELEVRYRELKAKQKELEDQYRLAEVSREGLAKENIELHSRIKELEKMVSKKDEEIFILKQSATKKPKPVDEELKIAASVVSDSEDDEKATAFTDQDPDHDEIKIGPSIPNSNYDEMMARLIAMVSDDLEQSEAPSRVDIDVEERDEEPDGFVVEIDSYGRRKGIREIFTDALSHQIEYPDPDEE